MSRLIATRWTRFALVLLPLLALFVSGCGSTLLAPELSHQGRLLDSSGQPVVDGNYEVTYGIYNSLSGGTAVYTDTQTIAVQDGLFNATIGPAAALDPQVFARPTWLEVTVEGETLTPRQRLQGAPFAFSLSPGAVVQGPEDIDRSYAGFNDTGAALTVWNRDASGTGGHGLLALNQAAAPPAKRSTVAALLAIAAGGVKDDATGALGAIIRSENYRGLYAKGANSYYAATFDSNVGIQLTGGGNCSGCALSYPAFNAGAAAIAPGDFVAVRGVQLDEELKVPVMQVVKAAAGETAVIGVASAALQREATQDFYGAAMGGYNQIDGPAVADAYLMVVVQGLVRARIPARDSNALGQDLRSAAGAPAIGRLMSAPESDGLAWVLLGGQ